VCYWTTLLVTKFRSIASDGSWMPNDVLGSKSPCQFAHRQSHMGWPWFFCSNWVITSHCNSFSRWSLCGTVSNMDEQDEVFYRVILKKWRNPRTGETILVQMSLGKIRIICFSSKEISARKRTCTPCFEVSDCLTCDITSLILLNIMACNILKDKDTCFNLVEIIIFAYDCYAFGVVQPSLFLICNKQRRRLTCFILRHCSCLTVVYLVNRWIVFVECSSQ